jgi:CBS domain containing-hemolysin-like protein
MFTFLLVVSILVFIALLLVNAMVPHRSSFSAYELERRASSGEENARRSLKQQRNVDSIAALLSLKVNVLLIGLSFLLVAIFGWIIGGLSIIAVLLLFRIISKLKFIRTAAGQIYDRVEPKLLSLIENSRWLRTIIRSNNHQSPHVRIGSRSELQHLIDQSEDILSAEEKKLVVHSLSFSDKTVGDIMIPADKITSLKKTEFLGPLTLDELHKSGHSRLPVIGTDINHIVGILHLDSLLALDTKRSVTAEKAMDSHVHYIRQDQTLPRALAALLRTHQHLFIVIDKSRLTVGIITLDDVIEALIGRRIIDDFDGHESIRAVAEHDPKDDIQ